MATATVEAVYVPDNLDGKKYMQYQQWRLRIWICAGISILIVLSAALAFIFQILNFSTFLSQTYDLSEGDMRLISVSTAFCEEISLGEDSSKRKLWILSSSRLSPQLRRTNMSTEVFVSKFKYWYKGFYLLEGSSVVINAESKSPLKLFIFKDRKRLDEWIHQNGDSSVTSDLTSEAEYSTQPSRISYTLSVQETGNYFILFKYARREKNVSKMKLGMIVNRKVYDVESSVFSCSADANEACSARLLFGSSEVGVLEVTGEPLYLSNELVTTWRCEPRIWFYLAIFVGPILFVTVASFVFYFVFINRKRDRHIQKLAFQRQNALRRASDSNCNRCNSIGNRSLNGSLRPPSRTPSTCSLGNQTDVSRSASLQPVVTTMYTGNTVSEDSGHDTDDNDKRTGNSGRRSKKRTSSVDGTSLVSQESISRRPSFSTFQGSEDEGSNATGNHVQSEAVASRKRNGKDCDIHNGRSHAGDRASKAPKTRRDRYEMRDKIPNGTIPRNSSTRRYSSDELYDHKIKTLPCNWGNTAPAGHSDSQRHPELQVDRPGTHSSTRRYSSDELYDHKIKKLPRNRGNTAPAGHSDSQLEPELQLLHDRPASLPCLQCPDGAWGLPLDLVPDCRPKVRTELEFCRPREESTVDWEPQEIKLRTYSGRRREMGWAPRLSMVAEA